MYKCVCVNLYTIYISSLRIHHHIELQCHTIQTSNNTAKKHPNTIMPRTKSLTSMRQACCRPHREASYWPYVEPGFPCMSQVLLLAKLSGFLRVLLFFLRSARSSGSDLLVACRWYRVLSCFIWAWFELCVVVRLCACVYLRVCVLTYVGLCITLGYIVFLCVFMFVGWSRGRENLIKTLGEEFAFLCFTYDRYLRLFIFTLGMFPLETGLFPETALCCAE